MAMKIVSLSQKELELYKEICEKGYISVWRFSYNYLVLCKKLVDKGLIKRDYNTNSHIIYINNIKFIKT